MAALATCVAVAGACRPGTVRIDPDQQVGDRARYRYEIEATITRSIDGGEPTATTISATLLADQEIVALVEGGVEAEVTLRRDGGAARTARVVLDRSGAISHIELVEGLDGDVLGLSELGPLILPATTAPPRRALAPGERWSISEGESVGHGRLLRLGVVDGTDVAVVETSVSETIDDAVAAGSSPATLTGERRADGTVTYDLDDGSVRRSMARSHGDLWVRLEPPAGVDAEPALGTISYDIEVRLVRLD